MGAARSARPSLHSCDKPQKAPDGLHGFCPSGNKHRAGYFFLKGGSSGLVVAILPVECYLLSNVALRGLGSGLPACFQHPQAAASFFLVGTWCSGDTGPYPSGRVARSVPAGGSICLGVCPPLVKKQNNRARSIIMAREYGYPLVCRRPLLRPIGSRQKLGSPQTNPSGVRATPPRPVKTLLGNLGFRSAISSSRCLGDGGGV